MEDQLRQRSVGAPAARSVLLTVLGEYVAPGYGAAWQESLVNALQALGYKHQAARQAVARSITAGWLEAERHGRRSRVSLTPRVREMLASGAERIYGFGDSRDWDGSWLLVMLRVPESRRDLRHQLRTQLAWAGFGSLGGGVWISPHIEREAEVESIASRDAAAEMQSFHAQFGALGDPREVVANAWDLDAVAGAYRQFIVSFRNVAPKTPKGAFQAQTRLVHAWRKFPFLDPDLPDSILPSRWPRSTAHKLFAEKHAAWSEPARAYFASLDIEQATPSRAVYAA